ncbi:MAG TPA: hypothetical protein VLA09_07305 [Longimicrobiales bacterium]|nr:hypothetical protein [Longimicrobiales bacterium]
MTIYAHDEKEYVVNARSMVKKLLKHADEEVEVQGYLTEDEYGDEVLLVSDFTVLTETTEEDLEFEDEEFPKEAEGGTDDEDGEDEDDEWWDNSQDDEDLVWADDDEDDSWKRFRDR